MPVQVNPPDGLQSALLFPDEFRQSSDLAVRKRTRPDGGRLHFAGKESLRNTIVGFGAEEEQFRVLRERAGAGLLRHHPTVAQKLERLPVVAADEIEPAFGVHARNRKAGHDKSLFRVDFETDVRAGRAAQVRAEHAEVDDVVIAAFGNQGGVPRAIRNSRAKINRESVAQDIPELRLIEVFRQIEIGALEFRDFCAGVCAGAFGGQTGSDLADGLKRRLMSIQTFAELPGERGIGEQLLAGVGPARL